MTQSRWLIQHCCSSGSPRRSLPPSPVSVSVGAAELAGLGALDLPAKLECHRLHAVTDSEHGDAQLEQFGPQARRAFGVDRRGPAREDECPRGAVADALQ